MYQIRNLINRQNVVSSPSNDVNASEDFFELVTSSHILAAAMEIFGMESLSDSPDPLLFPPGNSDKSVRSVVLQSGVKAIMSQYVDLNYPAQKQDKVDHIQEYAKEVLTLGLFHLEFHDAVREGDGNSVERLEVFTIVFQGYSASQLCH